VGNAVGLLPEGGIAVAAYAVPFGAGYHVMAEARFTGSGGIDTTFGQGGAGYVQVPNPNGVDSKAAALAIQPDARSIVAGFQGSADSVIVRLLVNGTADSAFGNPDASDTIGMSTLSVGNYGISQIALLSGGDILASLWSSAFQIIRLTPAGGLDTTYGSGGVASDTLSSALTYGAIDMVGLPDGAAVCVGSTGSTIELARFLADGTLDPSFGDAGRASVPSVLTALALAQTPDGAFVVGLSTRPSGAEASSWSPSIRAETWGSPWTRRGGP
jgi:uncharacterized delta-60 repeat protein